jgi:hypothetical protein
MARSWLKTPKPTEITEDAYGVFDEDRLRRIDIDSRNLKLL